MTYDIAIVGGGIVGLATARALHERAPRARLILLEKEPRLATHQTGHNSGVIHSGIYYRPGSHKARLCVEGKALMYRFCEEHGIRVERCGKVIVATAEAEVPRLMILHERATANGVPSELLEPARLRELEPHAAAVWGPTRLTATELHSHDVRAGMDMLLAALSAKGTSVIRDPHGHIERGYEDIVGKLKRLGADITRH